MDKKAQVIGSCEIIEKIGQGGMGAVYKAKHQTLGRESAVKLLPQEYTANKMYVQRFLREARAAAQLKHPNVVQVYDAGEQGGQYFINMEFVEGSNLAQRLHKGGPLSEAEGLAYLRQAAAGLQAAHKKGLVHRDIKPENMLIDQEGMLKIVDFGLVTAAEGDSALTKSGMMMGTPFYMSPEQCEGEPADTRSDIYSLGASFYRLLTGSAPFNAPTPLGILYKHKHDPTPNVRRLRPELSESTAQLLARMMSKNASDRFSEAGEIISAVDSISRGGTPYFFGGPLPLEGIPSPAMNSVTTPAHTMPGVVTNPALMATVTPGSGVAVTPQNPALTPPIANTPPGVINTPHPNQPIPSSGHMPVAQTPQPGTPIPQVQQYGNAQTPHPSQLGMPANANSSYIQSSGQMPVAHQPAKSGSKGILLGVLAVLFLLVLAGGGLVFGFIIYPQQQIDKASAQAQKQRENGQYEEALATLAAASSEYPDAKNLKEQATAIEAEYINKQLDKLRDTAEKSMEVETFSPAILALQQAMDLLDKNKHLPGVDVDPTLAALKEKAERALKYQTLMKNAANAMASKNYTDAENYFKEAIQYESGSAKLAEGEMQRAKFFGFKTQAEGLEKVGKHQEAVDEYVKAQALGLEDLNDKIQSLRTLIAFNKKVDEAKQLEQDGKLIPAATAFEEAAKISPAHDDAATHTAHATEIRKDVAYAQEMKKGGEALGTKRWKDAQTAFKNALSIRDKQEAKVGLNDAYFGEAKEQGDTAFLNNDLTGATISYEKALEYKADAALKTKLTSIKKTVQNVSELKTAARKAEASKDWDLARRYYDKLKVADAPNLVAYEQRAKNATYNSIMTAVQEAKAQGRLQEALGLLRKAEAVDPTGGQVARGEAQSIQNELDRQEKASQIAAAKRDGVTLVKQGKIREALAMLEAASKQAPSDVELSNMVGSLKTVSIVEGSYANLENNRSDAEAAITNALAQDDDKKIKRALISVKDWQGKLAANRGSAQAAWLQQGDYSGVNASYAQMQSQARDLGNYLQSLSANFSGWAASKRKPKARIGSGISVGGLLGGRHRTRVGTGFGVSGDVGDNQTTAGIFEATAQALGAAAANCKTIANR